MQFASFHWLSRHGIWAIIPWSTKMASACVIFLGLFVFIVVSSFLIIIFFGGGGAFLIKQLLHSRLLDMRWL